MGSLTSRKIGISKPILASNNIRLISVRQFSLNYYLLPNMLLIFKLVYTFFPITNILDPNDLLMVIRNFSMWCNRLYSLGQLFITVYAFMTSNPFIFQELK